MFMETTCPHCGVRDMHILAQRTPEEWIYECAGCAGVFAKPHVHARLELAVPGVNVDYAGGLCPWQAEGYVATGERAGLAFYARFRFDDAQLYVFAPDPPETDRDEWWGFSGQRTENTLWYNEIHDVTGDEYNGGLLPAEAVDVFRRLWDGLLPIDEWEGGTRVDRIVAALKAADEERQAGD